MRIRSAAWLVIAQASNLLLSFPLSVLLARQLGPEGKGSLTLVQMVAATGAVLLSLGLGNALSYYVAKREVERPRRRGARRHALSSAPAVWLR